MIDLIFLLLRICAIKYGLDISYAIQIFVLDQTVLRINPLFENTDGNIEINKNATREEFRICKLHNW